ncbi:hypothetical protein [Sphingomonas sp. Leaf257]|uniref:hypothetical protein n=1 Tax=Sphingomonas sp. Leaf257 TaxID=1736309 RepID=UPI0006F551C9|nr:hypothetical protein [Sphingomonas sp. Leaf257]KQO57686.1 hypothetical protein ASF14_14735 [Sphingomonas sp. Leaf257]
MGGLAAQSKAVTLAASEAALRQWVMMASIGDRLTFATGKEPPRNEPVWKAARSMVDLGLIRTFQPRRPDGRGFDFVAQRIESPIAIQDPCSRSVRVFAEIARCVAAGEPMPTDRQLAKRCGLAHADDASNALRKLKKPEAGDRQIHITNWGRQEHRQATILATGQMTIRRKF